MKIKPKHKNHGTRANKAGTEPASSYLFGNCAMLFIVLGMAAALFAFGHCPNLPISHLPSSIRHPPTPNAHTPSAAHSFTHCHAAGPPIQINPPPTCGTDVYLNAAVWSPKGQWNNFKMLGREIKQESKSSPIAYTRTGIATSRVTGAAVMRAEE